MQREPVMTTPIASMGGVGECEPCGRRCGGSGERYGRPILNLGPTKRSNHACRDSGGRRRHKQVVGAAAEASLTGRPQPVVCGAECAGRGSRLWDDPAGHKSCSGNAPGLDQAIGSYQRIEREVAETSRLIELAEAEVRLPLVADAEATLERLRAEAARRELESLLSARRRQRLLSRGPCRGGRHRGAGLGP